MGIVTAARNTPGPPSIPVLRAMVDSTNVTASVRRPKSSPRTPRTRNTTAAMAAPRSPATSPAAGSHRNGQRLAGGNEDRRAQQPERVAQPADDHRGKHHADPRVDLRGRQRMVERDEESGDARIRRAEPGQQQGEPAAVDAE